MFYMNNNTKNEDELTAPMLAEAVESLAACSSDLMVVAEAITQSCNMVENLEETHKDVLVIRAEALKRLASLYNLRMLTTK